jgi:quinoprotein glucose dehydrogenase
VQEEDLIDFTPELHKEAAAFVSKYDHGPLFTPPSEKGTINLPGWGGGANWAGAAFDPETGLLYVPSITAPIVVTLTKAPGFISHARYIGAVTPLVTTPSGLPLVKPPYGRITAIDLNKGSHAWMIPLGEGPRNHPALKAMQLPPLGWDRRGFLFVTKTLLFAGQEPGQVNRAATPSQGHTLDVDFMKDDPKLYAFDKRTGKLVCAIDLPANATGAPMTYLMNGKQYIIIPVGGGDKPAELVALSLP